MHFKGIKRPLCGGKGISIFLGAQKCLFLTLSVLIPLSIHIATNIQMAVLPKVRTSLCAASQLPGEVPTDVEDAPAPAF